MNETFASLCQISGKMLHSAKRQYLITQFDILPKNRQASAKKSAGIIKGFF
ncbi:hypothetical protein [Sporomusa rhizae]|uniref:hypothetical protein n=1 Tax=Sporomusa rhizae TaxID=357999 RepID=UPI00352A1C99